MHVFHQKVLWVGHLRLEVCRVVVKIGISQDGLFLESNSRNRKSFSRKQLII